MPVVPPYPQCCRVNHSVSWASLAVSLRQNRAPAELGAANAASRRRAGCLGGGPAAQEATMRRACDARGAAPNRRHQSEPSSGRAEPAFGARVGVANRWR